MKILTLCIPCRCGFGACLCADPSPRCDTCGAQCYPAGSRCDCGGVGIHPHAQPLTNELPF